MTDPSSRLRFGAFTFPVHRPDHDPTIQLEQDIELAEHADRLGLDEFWWGEHHSGGWQIVADPMLMVARAAASTRRIRLGTGVSALAYHHPKLLLDSAIQLDHLTRGRFVFGVGAGSLAVDSTMIGIEPMEVRQAMAESLSAMMRLLQGGEPVSMTPRHAPWLLRDAYLHLMPYTGALDIRVASYNSPVGPQLAGEFGTGMISFAPTASIGLGATYRLTEIWDQAQQAAEQHGTRVPRERWSAMSPVHIAPTEIEARRQVRYGIARYADYIGDVLPIDVPRGGDPDTIVDALHASGHAVVGTPAMAIEHIERVMDLSGGIGTFLIEHAGWTTLADAKASMELFAREVIPRFSGSTRARLEAYARQIERGDLNRRTLARAQDAAELRHAVSRARRPRHASDEAAQPSDSPTSVWSAQPPAAPSALPERAPSDGSPAEPSTGLPVERLDGEASRRGAPPRWSREVLPDAGHSHDATPARGITRQRHEPPVPRITTDELGPMRETPRRRGRHAMEP